MNVGQKLSSVNLTSMEVFPTLLSPIRSNLNKTSYLLSMVECYNRIASILNGFDFDATLAQGADPDARFQACRKGLVWRSRPFAGMATPLNWRTTPPSCRERDPGRLNYSIPDYSGTISTNLQSLGGEYALYFMALGNKY